MQRTHAGRAARRVKRLVAGGGARLNDVKIDDPNLLIGSTDFDAETREIKLSSGKKKHGIIELV